MRIKIFKTVLFLLAFLFFQGIILPWTISTNLLPVWLIIVIVSLILLLWLLALDKIAKEIFPEKDLP